MLPHCVCVCVSECMLSDIQGKTSVRGGSEQMEGGWRANRKWGLDGFLMLCWQQSRFHFPVPIQPTGAGCVSVQLYSIFTFSFFFVFYIFLKILFWLDNSKLNISEFPIVLYCGGASPYINNDSTNFMKNNIRPIQLQRKRAVEIHHTVTACT